MMLAVGLRSAPCPYLLSTIMFCLSQCLNFFCLLCLILLLQCLILLSLSYLIHLILYVDSLIPCVYSLIHCLTLFCFMNDNSVSSDQVDVEFHVFLFECWMFSFVLFSDLTLDYAGYDVVPANVDLFRYGRCSLPLCWCCGSRTDLLVDVIISHQRGIFLFTIWICPSCLWFSCSLMMLSIFSLSEVVRCRSYRTVPRFMTWEKCSDAQFDEITLDASILEFADEHH